MNQKFKLIVGLGNPTKEYENTRHNIGFITLDALATKYKLIFKNKKEFSSFCIKAAIAVNEKLFNVILAKPTTYMNNSGSAVKNILDWFKVDSHDMIVVHDEVALPLGKIRISVGRSSAGHNGIESIIEKTGDKEFTRLRIGIGPDPGGDSRKEYVLNKFNKKEQEHYKIVVNVAVEAIETLITSKTEEAMNKYNGLEIGSKK